MSVLVILLSLPAIPKKKELPRYLLVSSIPQRSLLTRDFLSLFYNLSSILELFYIYTYTKSLSRRDPIHPQQIPVIDLMESKPGIRLVDEWAVESSCIGCFFFSLPLRVEDASAIFSIPLFKDSKAHYDPFFYSIDLSHSQFGFFCLCPTAFGVLFFLVEKVQMVIASITS